MSTARRLTTIVAAFLLVATVLFIAHRQGQRSSAGLSKSEFISRADAVCTAAQRQVKAIEVAPINIGGAVTKDRLAWLTGVERRRKVVLHEVDQLHALVPPSEFRKKWTGVVNDLGAAAAAMIDLETAVRKILPSDAEEVQGEIELIGQRTATVMRDYGLQVCSQPSSSSSGPSTTS